MMTAADREPDPERGKALGTLGAWGRRDTHAARSQGHSLDGIWPLSLLMGLYCAPSKEQRLFYHILWLWCHLLKPVFPNY